MICLIFFIKLLSVSAGPATLKLGKNEVDIHRHKLPRPEKTNQYIYEEKSTSLCCVFFAIPSGLIGRTQGIWVIYQKVCI